MLEADRRGSLKNWMTYLERSAVFPGTDEKYRLAVTEWKKWCAAQALQSSSAEEIDLAVVMFFNHFFLEGKNPWKVELVLAGLMHLMPEFSKAGTLSLPRTLRCLTGWRRRCPTRTRVPWGWDVWTAVAIELCHQGYLRIALAVLVGVDSFWP